MKNPLVSGVGTLDWKAYIWNCRNLNATLSLYFEVFIFFSLNCPLLSSAHKFQHIQLHALPLFALRPTASYYISLRNLSFVQMLFESYLSLNVCCFHVCLTTIYLTIHLSLFNIWKSLICSNFGLLSVWRNLLDICEEFAKKKKLSLALYSFFV